MAAGVGDILVPEIQLSGLDNARHAGNAGAQGDMGDQQMTCKDAERRAWGKIIRWHSIARTRPCGHERGRRQRQVRRVPVRVDDEA